MIDEREIVRFHEGRIRVETADPHGARFVITLPFEEALGESPVRRLSDAGS